MRIELSPEYCQAFAIGLAKSVTLKFAVLSAIALVAGLFSDRPLLPFVGIAIGFTLSSGVVMYVLGWLVIQGSRISGRWSAGRDGIEYKRLYILKDHILWHSIARAQIVTPATVLIPTAGGSVAVEQTRTLVLTERTTNRKITLVASGTGWRDFESLVCPILPPGHPVREAVGA